MSTEAQSEINRISQNLANTYAVLSALGADMPAQQNSDNLADTAGSVKVLLHSEQTLTEDQKTQARTNIGAEKTGTAEAKVKNHNESVTSHQDIRQLIDGLSNGKLDAGKLQEAINTALAQAKASGEFDGEDGRGIKTIARTSGTGAAGTTDTYTITYTDDTTSTFQVRNGSNALADISILLPASDVAVVGREYNIYKENIIFSSIPVDHYDVCIDLNDSSAQAYNYHEVWRATPTTAGTYTLTVTVRDTRTGVVYATKTMTLYVVDNTAVVGRNALFIGDSLTAAGIYPAEIQHNLSGGGITSIGTIETTRTIDGVSLTAKHEGRNGWATWDYAGTKADSLSKFDSDANVFRNPSTNKFDLGYYLDTYHPGITLNAVCINLGTNGIGAQISVCAGMDEMIARIREYSATLPILIHIPIPVAGQDYRAGMRPQTTASSPYIRMRWYYLAVEYLEKYQGMENVHIVPVYCNIDGEHDFPTIEVAVSARNPAIISRVQDGHPNVYGYLKMADVYYAHLMRYMYDDGATYYTVTASLTNATLSNTAERVKEGDAYSATIAAASGYTFDGGTVTVTMGGVALTVEDGVINIPAVTGDIIITAEAVVMMPPSYTNLADPSTANDASPNTELSADEWLNGYMIRNKTISAIENIIVTNRIPATNDDTIRIKGFKTDGNVAGSTAKNMFRVLPFNASGNALMTELMPAQSNSNAGTGRLESMDADELANGVYCFQFADIGSGMTGSMAFVRICGWAADGNDKIIVTVNEEIPT